MPNKYASAVTDDNINKLLKIALSGERSVVTEKFDDTGTLVSKVVSISTDPKSAAASLRFADSLLDGSLGVFDAATKVGDALHIIRPKRLPSDPLLITDVVSNRVGIIGSAVDTVVNTMLSGDAMCDAQHGSVLDGDGEDGED
jgi:hypothetical protein